MLQRTKQALAAVLPGTRSSTLFREESCGGHQKLLPLPGEAPGPDIRFCFALCQVQTPLRPLRLRTLRSNAACHMARSHATLVGGCVLASVRTTA